jgi:hypothetical protein
MMKTLLVQLSEIDWTAQAAHLARLWRSQQVSVLMLRLDTHVSQ